MLPKLLLIPIVIAGGLVVACSGSSPGATSPGNAAQTQAAATSGAQPTDAAGQPTAAAGQPTDAAGQPTAAAGQPTDGGGGGGTNSIHWEISGSTVDQSGDYKFISVASVFSGDTTSLSFSNETTTNVFGVLIVKDVLGFSFGTPDWTISASPGPDCTTADLHVDAATASGSFDCKNVPVLFASGGQGTAEVKATFNALK